MSACLDCGGHGRCFAHCTRDPDEWCSGCSQKHSKCECGPPCRCATLRPGDDCPAHPFDPTQYRPVTADDPRPAGEACDHEWWIDAPLRCAACGSPWSSKIQEEAERLAAPAPSRPAGAGELLAALCKIPTVWTGEWGPGEIAEFLAPTLDRIASERERKFAAAELEAAAWEIEAARPHIPPSNDPSRRTSVIVRSTLNKAARIARAAALRAATGEEAGR